MRIEDLDRIDTKHMYKIYNKWPEIAKESFEGVFEKLEFDGIDHIVFAGMGGSGSLGDVISAILSKKDIHESGSPSHSAKKIIQEKGLELDQINGTGRDGRIIKDDVIKAVPSMGTPSKDRNRFDKREKLSMLRRKVA